MTPEAIDLLNQATEDAVRELRLLLKNVDPEIRLGAARTLLDNAVLLCEDAGSKEDWQE